ncbi:AAA family ATPase [Salinibacterium hongtaonis]|uniref:Regulator n=1 Tax=Homoserinimonas hongtaonis TaxID=2079791 RepID=A0A2U1SWW4_9MICO|nr:regulator [Salinibacterium hongtaonis]PWB96088.1 regulator [Salinibacterium hongtaonis]
MARIAFAVPIAYEDSLVAEAQANGHDVVARCGSAGELASLLGATRPDVAVTSAAERYLTPQLLAEADREGVRLVAIVDTDSDRRNALTVGLHEVVDRAEWAQIEGMLLATPAPAPGVAAPRAGRGIVIAVWGPAGSPGRTSLAITIAAELASAGTTVALADVDTYSGSIAPTLGLLDEAPGFAAACRLAGADALTNAELERIGQRYSSPQGSFWVLTGIGRPSRWPELSADRVRTALEQCRGWVDYTVVDTGFNLENDEEISSDVFAPRRNAATLQALRSADHIVAVGSADPVGLSRFLRAHVDLIDTIVTDRITVVMNRLRASVIGAAPSVQVAKSLERFGGVTDAVFVPNDPAAFDAALLRGATLLDSSARSPARAAIGALVRERLLAPGGDQRQGGRRRRPRQRRDTALTPRGG